MQFAIIFVLAFLAFAAAFAPSRFAIRANAALNSECPENKKDKKGRCPGDSGYVPFVRDAPSDFASVSFQSF